MSRYRRSRSEGATFFFTVNTFRRQALLTEEPVRVALRDSLKRTRDLLPFKVHAWVLLPDHLHCIWELPPGDADFGKRWGLIKTGVTRAVAPGAVPPAGSSRTKRHESTIWQRRFWEHQIRDDGDFERHADYIHWNPVKHGHVRRASDWPYSTFHRFVRAGIYSEDWGGNVAARGDSGNFGE